MGGSLSDCPSLSMPLAACHQCFLHSNFRIVPSFTFSCLLPTTLSHSNFWDPTRCYIRYVRQKVVYHYTARIMFSHFLIVLLTSSFAAKPPHSLPTDMVTFSLEGPLGPTTNCNVSDDAWRCWHAPLTLSLHTHAMSPCHSQLHALCYCACASFPLLICFLFSFSINSLFFSPLTTLSWHHTA